MAVFEERLVLVLVLVCVSGLLSCRGPSDAPRAAASPPPRVVQHIDSLMELRQFDAAIAYLQQQVEANPDMRLLHLSLGYAYGNKGDHESAIAHFEKELELDTGSWLAVSLLGQAHENRGDIEKAIEYFATWRKMQPDRWEPHYREGSSCLEFGDMECAKRAFDEGIRLNPRSADLLVGKGKVQMMEEDLRGAQESFAEAFVLDASNADANYNLGQVLIRLGEVEQGQRVLEQFRKLSVRQDELDFLRQSRDVAEGGAENTFAVGEALLKRGQLDEAMREYRNATTVDSTFWPAYHRMAFIQTRQGDYSAALVSLERAERLTTDNFEIRFDLAKNHALLRQTEQARGWLERALEIRPLNAAETRFISELFVRTGMEEEGLQTLRNWTAANPADHESMFVMGLLLHLTNDVAAAETYYARASELAPSEGKYSVVRSMALMALGRADSARSALRPVSADEFIRNYSRYKSLDGAAELAGIAGDSLGISVAG